MKRKRVCEFCNGKLGAFEGERVSVVDLNGKEVDYFLAHNYPCTPAMMKRANENPEAYKFLNK